MKDISIYKRGNGFNKNSIIECGRNPIILYGHLFTLYKNNIDNVKMMTNEQGIILSVKNSLLVPGSSTSKNDFFPFCSLNINNIYLGSDINIFEINSQNNSLYLSYLFSNLSYMKKVWRLSEGTSVNHLYGEYIRNIKIFLPVIDEQLKIAKFLSLLDKQIELYGSKLALTEKIKLFYLNNLFTSNELPKLRFRGFNEINSDKLKNISLIKGAGINKIIKENEEHVFLINYMDVYKNKQLNKIKFMESSANNSDIKKYKVEYGDILITPSSENKTDIGLSSIVDFDPKELTLYSYHLNCIRVISTKINPLWLNFYFSSPFIKKYFYEVSQGITRYTLSKNDFESINVKYPCLDEQSKIAKFLSLLDRQIWCISNKIKILYKLRKFYVNCLFI